jgi:hypothetical protein
VRKLVGTLVVAAAVAGTAVVAQADEPSRPDFPVVVPQEAAPAPAPAAPAPVATCCEQAVNWSFGMSTSYVFDFGDPEDVQNGAPPGFSPLNSTGYASFEQDESFNIDLVQLGATGQRGALSYGAKVDFGDLAALAGDSDDGDIALQEAYLTWEFADGISSTAGRFGTPIGYELLEPWGNPNISRSWTWIGQPINHDGIKVGGSLANIDMMVGVVNNFTVNDPNGNDFDDEKGIIGSIGASISDAFNIYGAGLWTEEADDTHVYIANGILSGDLDMGEEGMNYAVEGMWRRDDSDTFDENDMWSIAGYFGFDLGPLALNLRGEYVDDEGVSTPDFPNTNQASVLGTDAKLWAATVTGSVELVDGVSFRMEYRHDDADEDIFADDDETDDVRDLIQAQLIWTP